MLSTEPLISRNTEKVENNHLAIALSIVTSLARIFPHPFNITPNVAFCIYSGAFLPKRLGLGLIIVTSIVTDVVLSLIRNEVLFGWYTIMVYGCFMISFLISFHFYKWKLPVVMPLVIVTSSFQFFILTNIWVFLTSGMYPLTGQGFLECFGPKTWLFYRNSLIGDAVYSPLFVGCHRIAYYSYTTIKKHF
jgi:hypothetical protein